MGDTFSAQQADLAGLSVLGKQGKPVRVYYFASSVQMDAFCKNACWDEFPNPKIAQVRLRVQRRFFIFSKQASQFFLNRAVAAKCNYRSLSFTPSAVFQSTFPLDVCPKITADAADGALNS